ncbi:DUF4184 family protein [Roseiconus lacunae]|uniref:DUF4184 family protein n=1 Tax=Roseiconus lacunae TaxID=2605694 RepID=A0ABT7PNN9_9BACT|nr:DUF4184 family protein [Roseiconus lacunae]MDM4018114.1 DUF4184 family protein [Roseiconus lacunae]
MPFTPTHILAVVPFGLKAKWLPMSALAIGAMVPDIALFFPIVDYARTHSATGVVFFCGPMGIGLFLLFDLLMRKPLCTLLPNWIRCRIDPRPRLPHSSTIAPVLTLIVQVGFAVVIGSSTHVIWDAFTHEGRWGTKLVPALEMMWSIGPFQLRGYKLFQYGSTFVGLPLLVLIAWWKLRGATSIASGAASIGIRSQCLTFLLAAVAIVIVSVHAFLIQPVFYRALGIAIKQSGAILMIGSILWCIAFHLVGRRSIESA